MERKYAALTLILFVRGSPHPGHIRHLIAPEVKPLRQVRDPGNRGNAAAQSIPRVDGVAFTIASGVPVNTWLVVLANSENERLSGLNLKPTSDGVSV